MKKYEFYIYSEAGEDVWCWDLNQTNKVIKDIKGLMMTPSALKSCVIRTKKIVTSQKYILLINQKTCLSMYKKQLIKF